MKTKARVILSTVVALLLLAAAIAAGLNAVFTVTYVRADFSTFSDCGAADAENLKQELDKFVGKSTTFLDLADVEEVVKGYPHFKIDSLGKKFPSTVEIALSERRERYAFRDEGEGYVFLDGEGKYLTEGNADIANRAGGQNILLENFGLTVTETGEVQGEYFGELLTAMDQFEKVLGEVRANVLSVAVELGTTDRENVIFRVQMTEGVVLVLDDPVHLTADKAALAIVRYGTLADAERLYGLLTVYETEDGRLRTSFVQRDPFA